MANKILNNRMSVTNKRCLIFVFLYLLIVFTVKYPTFRQITTSEAENTLYKELSKVGHAQKLYSNRNNRYGSFETLKNNYPINLDFELPHVTNHYKITAFNVNNKPSNGLNTYTVIAIPVRTRLKLRTFAITDQDEILIWVGDDYQWDDKKYSFKDELSWRHEEDFNPNFWRTY